MEIAKTTTRYLMEKWAMRSLHPLLVHHHPPFYFFFLFLFLIKQTINWALRKETFPRFSAVCIIWHTVIAFSLYIFYRFLSTKLLSLSLSSKVLCCSSKGAWLVHQMIWKERVKSKEVPLFWSIHFTGTCFSKEKKKGHWGRHVCVYMYAHFIVLTISPQPRIWYNKKRIF